MVLLDLFWSFCKIGFTSFGGLSMVPLINSEMLTHGWMTHAEVSDIVAIAEMTPGPLGLNCAIFAGTRVAGLLGAICASIGVLSPTFLVGAAVAVMFEKFKDSTAMQKALFGIRPGCLGMIIGVCVALLPANYTTLSGGYSPAAMATGAISLLALWKWKAPIPLVIAVSAALGLLLIR